MCFYTYRVVWYLYFYNWYFMYSQFNNYISFIVFTLVSKFSIMVLFYILFICIHSKTFLKILRKLILDLLHVLNKHC
jgi:hypothetical protein